MYIKTLCFSVLTLLSFTACNPIEESDIDENDTSGRTSDVTIRLVELNDLHAHLLPHNELVKVDGKTVTQSRGGIAKIATTIKKLRNKEENTILMNIGDTFHGGAEATFSIGNAIVDSVNALNVDIGVIGNWDFAYSPIVTKLRFTDKKPNSLFVSQTIGDYEVKKVNYDVLAANWFESSLFSDDELMVSPTRIITKDGVKIGFIGLTSDIVERMHKGFALGMSFTQGKENYIQLVNKYTQELKSANCDLIMVMSELGIHKDVALANAVKSGVDVFFSAHTHELTREPIESQSGALVVESGDDTYLGVMDINITEDAQKIFSWKIEEITADIEDDIEVAAIVKKDRKAFLADDVNIKNPLKQSSSVLTQPLDKVLAYSEINLNRRGLLENSFNTAFTDLLMQESNTQLAITPGFRYDAVIDAESDFETKGEIKVSDVYRFFPSSFTLSKAKIDGKHLKEIYEQMLEVVLSKDHFKQNGGWVEKVGGVRAKVDISKDFNQRLVDMKLIVDDSNIQDDTLYSITGCSRPFDDDDELCSYTGFTQKKEFINPETSNVYNVSEFFIEMLQKDLFHPKAHSDITDVSGIELNKDFIQPLWE